eukprot:8207263-Ditylum_brightwellii.AAC.1
MVLHVEIHMFPLGVSEDALLIECPLCSHYGAIMIGSLVEDWENISSLVSHLEEADIELVH